MYFRNHILYCNCPSKLTDGQNSQKMSVTLSNLVSRVLTQKRQLAFLYNQQQLINSENKIKFCKPFCKLILIILFVEVNFTTHFTKTNKIRADEKQITEKAVRKSQKKSQALFSAKESEVHFLTQTHVFKKPQDDLQNSRLHIIIF